MPLVMLSSGREGPLEVLGMARSLFHWHWNNTPRIPYGLWMARMSKYIA